MNECFYCRKKTENVLEKDGKKFCSEECIKEYNKKLEKMLEGKNTCEFC